MKAGLERIEIQWRDRLVADDQAIGAVYRRGKIVSTSQQATADDDRVAAFAEIDGDTAVACHVRFALGERKSGVRPHFLRMLIE